MVLNTTTKINRNLEFLAKAKEVVSQNGIDKPVILELGPGGIVDYFKNLMTTVTYKDDFVSRLKNRILRLTECALRKTNLFELYTFEPIELYSSLSSLNPAKVIVVDIEKKVLDGAKRVVSKAGLIDKFEFLEQDLSKDCSLPSSDLVIAYNLLIKFKNPNHVLDLIAASLCSGGVLSINSNLNYPLFEKVMPCTYIRIQNG
jgi:hypothetical protein